MGRQNKPRKYQERKIDIKSDILYPAENAVVDEITSWVMRFSKRKVTTVLDFAEKKATEFIDIIKHGEIKALQTDSKQSEKKSKGGMAENFV